jgi:hypothetical protein
MMGRGFPTLPEEVPVTPSTVAVMVTDPGEAPDTRPEELTVATVVLELDQVTVLLVMVLPSFPRIVALSCWVEPAEMVNVDGTTETEETVTVPPPPGPEGPSTFTLSQEGRRRENPTRHDRRAARVPRIVHSFGAMKSESQPQDLQRHAIAVRAKSRRKEME